MAKQGDSGISWTDETWGPVRGCSRVSQGCTRCYAERIAARFSGSGQPYEGLAKQTPSGPRWTGNVKLIEERLLDPLKWRKPRRVFANSMSDLFHENLPDAAIDRVFAVMALAPQHCYQILTKRPERMLRYFSLGGLREELIGIEAERVSGIARHTDAMQPRWPIPLTNVWLGVSVEDQATADERIPLLLRTPAAVRFISAEPLLGPVQLARKWIGRGKPLGGGPQCDLSRPWEAPASMAGLDWFICGGESGPGARPMDIEWARSLRDQCNAAGVAFWMKQL
ncbi:MAG: phage Gp37/Gp68 family protein, partial [Bradyrhizobium sp.]|nr:phage Gp37/Gp68 family protein [Bradyrhizobium sp.]